MINFGYAARSRSARREHVWTPALASAMVSDRTRAAWLEGCADVAQLVEHHLAKVRVAGSNPVVRSERVSPSPCGEQCSPGGVAERRGNGLQIRVHGFKSRLHLGRLAQRERASLTRKRSLVQIQYRPPASHLVRARSLPDRPRRGSRDGCLPNCLPKPPASHAGKGRPSRSHRG